MALEKTQQRLDALSLANEGRLLVDDDDVTYWVASELNDTARQAQPPINTAAGELAADGDLEPGNANTGPNDLTPVGLTSQGAALYDEWSA
jgi:hypothetical protein